MPYYCTVPRCTSMAGKAKNVSFHQFPRDEELAILWNKILKRGKPYTKYSKVCSLHFRPEDYTVTSVGKNKGQWRTLRKDAIPSQNLPSESPVPIPPRRSPGAWVASHVPSPVMDARVQQQMAQAIYMQTMLAMQAANGTLPTPSNAIESPTDLNLPHTSNFSISDLEQLLKNTPKTIDSLQEIQEKQEIINQNRHTSFKCEDCSKCFKDPDVFVLHKRSHSKNSNLQKRLTDNLSVGLEKENLNSNSDLTRQETLRANPILANLLKSDISNTSDSTNPNVDDSNISSNMISIENHIMTALAVNMERYIRNLSTAFSEQAPKDEINSLDTLTNTQNNDLSPSDNDESSKQDSDEENYINDAGDDNSFQERNSLLQECQNLIQEDHNTIQENCNSFQEHFDPNQDRLDFDCNVSNSIDDCVKEQVCQFLKGSEFKMEPNCDNEDLNNSKDSNNLVIDENA